MRKAALWMLAAAVLLAGGISTYQFAFAGGRAIASPGAIAIDPDRPDCPGKVVCPITGELVCRDRCPLGPGGDREEEAPPCCRGRR